MAKFNIYKIKKENEVSLKEKFSSVGLEKTGEKNIKGFNLSLYISKNPKDIDIWWIDLYRDYIDITPKPKNKAYFSVFLIAKSDLLYAVSMGKSHFYLKDFCFTDFGIDLAERIVDEKNLKLKNSKLFGGKRNKTITSYQENSDLEYDSGESIQYLKAKTIDKNKWGDIVSFGNSVQFNLDIKPEQLIDLVLDIEKELLKKEKIILPRATEIIDTTKILELDNSLIQAIDDSDTVVQIEETSLSGVEFVFLDSNNFKFLFNRKTDKKKRELNLLNLKEYARENCIDLRQNLDNIKVKVSNEYEKGYVKPVKYFIDYVDNERNFLLNGHWHQFNQNYIDYLNNQIDSKIELQLDNDFKISEYEEEKKRLKELNQSIPYKEQYFNKKREEDDGYINFDRNIEQIQSVYKIEKMDLYKDKTLFFVKIGEPQKLSYAIDQATLTLKVLQNNTGIIKIEEREIEPEKICLWFVLDRKNKIRKISEIKSLIFLMKLAEWQRQCSNAGYVPMIKISMQID